MIVGASGQVGRRLFGLPSEAVVPVTMEEHPLQGNRPASTGLDISRAQAFLSKPMLSAEEGIARALAESEVDFS